MIKILSYKLHLFLIYMSQGVIKFGIQGIVIRIIHFFLILLVMNKEE